VGIIVLSDMSGRIAVVTGKPNFKTVKDVMRPKVSLVALIASLALTVLTLAAELGGMAFVLNYVFDVSLGFFLLVALVIMLAASWFLSFGWIERLFGYGGLGLLVYAAAAIEFDPDWGAVAHAFIPSAQPSPLYWFFVVGLIAAAMMPYEIYFYSSGAVEEEWTDKDLGVERANSILGFSLGGLLAVAILLAAAQTLHPLGIEPASIGDVAMIPELPFGPVGLALALMGIFSCVGGATIDTAFSSAYNLAQYQGWEWGKKAGMRKARRWTAALLAAFGIGFAIAATGVDPVELTEYAVILSAVVMPATFFPIVRIANDRSVMGEHASGPVARVLGWAYFGLICLLSVAAPVLLFMTNGGGG
jgi:Mn2+/Fe2+ NRAMP family transporter